jgi:hypothetical protein
MWRDSTELAHRPKLIWQNIAWENKVLVCHTSTGPTPCEAATTVMTRR